MYNYVAWLHMLFCDAELIFQAKGHLPAYVQAAWLEIRLWPTFALTTYFKFL